MATSRDSPLDQGVPVLIENEGLGGQANIY
jgi:hypothetical protein